MARRHRFDWRANTVTAIEHAYDAYRSR